MIPSDIINKYPRFVANQVLTQDQLNGMQTYLDTQNRATRVKLVGMGIVCGLHARIDTTDGFKVVISKGYGITSDGWLICIPQQEYIHIQPYTDPNVKAIGDDEFPHYRHWRKDFSETIGTGGDDIQISIEQLLEDEDLINESTSLTADDLKNKVLLLYLELKAIDLKSCFTTDCNNKGEEIQLSVRALLVNKEDRFNPALECKELQEIQYVPNFNAGLKVAVGKEVSEIDSTTEINGAYENIADYLNQELAKKIKLLFKNHKIYFDWLDLAAKIPAANHVLKLQTTPNQYDYDVLKDIAQAYNELVHHLCKIVEPCCNSEVFPRHLAIRDFDNNLERTEGYRNYFKSSRIRNVMHQDFQKARQFFVRILDLMECYLPNTEPTALPLPTNDIRITPSQSEAFPLANRAIPFYYKDTGIPTWQLSPCCVAPPLGYHWNNNSFPNPAAYPSYRESPLYFNLNACSLLRIEGHVHLSFQAAFDKIVDLRRIHHLDFQVLALPLVANKTSPLISPPILNEQFSTFEGTWDKVKKRENSIEEAIFEVKEIDFSKFVNWCNNQRNIKIPCDYTALQADYLVERAKLLCTLANCKNLQVPDFLIENKKVCIDFSSIQPFGKEYDTKEGTEIYKNDGIRLSAESFITNEGASVFNIGSFEESSLFTQQINIKFDFTDLAFNPSEVNFIYSSGSDHSNFKINDNKVGHDLWILTDKNIEVEPGIKLSITRPEDHRNRLEGTIIADAGKSISSITLGEAKGLSWYEMCLKGEHKTTLSPAGISINNCLAKITSACTILEKYFFQDLRCLHYPFVKYFITDIAKSIIEVKLTLAQWFNENHNGFNPYQYYPEWQDFEHCLQKLLGLCSVPTLAKIYYTFHASILQPRHTFGTFTLKYPGAAHRAGVSKGGTFIMVYQDENNPKVVADFSLEHFVEDCCTCEFDVSTIEFPPIAKADYKIIEIEKAGDTAHFEMQVILNDFNLGDNQKLTTDIFGALTSDKGANIQADFDLGIIEYKYEKAQLGIDHFIYKIKNDSGKTDIGDVYVLIVEKSYPTDTGTGKGRVVFQDNEAIGNLPIENATIVVISSEEGPVADLRSNNKGEFEFSGKAGNYALSIGHPNFLGLSFIDNNIFVGLTTEWGDFELSPTRIPPFRASKYDTVIDNYKDTLITSVYATVKDFQAKVSRSDIDLLGIEETYNETLSTLTANWETATSNKKAYSQLIQTVSHLYMDRLTIESQEKDITDAHKNLKRSMKILNDKGYPITALRNNWEADGLKDILPDAIDGINNISSIFKTIPNRS